MKIQQITDLDQLETLKADWNGLLSCNATNEIFLTWEWQNTWWRAYTPGELWVVAGYDDAGTLVGIAPWFIEQTSRVVRTVGCVEVTDYLDLIVKPDYRQEFFTALADLLVERGDSYSRIVLCNLPGLVPLLEAMPPLLTERGFTVNVEREEVCPVITLPETFEAYLEGLDKKQRHEVRRKVRRAEGSDTEKVGWYIVGPEHDLNAEIDKFVMLMAASHPDKEKFLQDPQNIAFFRAIVPVVANCGWLQLSFLTVNDKPAAAYLCFDFNNRILVYNSGLVPQTYSHLSPGIVLLAYLIEHAIELRRSAFDFLRGNEEYKYRMGGHDHPVMKLQAIRN